MVEHSETKKEESQFDFSIDRTDYFFYQALVFYCEENNIPSGKLSKSDMLEISKRAAFHLSIFVAWLAKHDFLNPQSDGFNLKGIQKLKNETITGTDYLFKHLDKKLYSTDISDILRPFISDFYEDFMDFYYAHLLHSAIIKLSVCSEIRLFLCRCDLERGIYDIFKKGFPFGGKPIN